MQKERIRKTCYYCGEKLTDGGRKIDFSVPRRGGYEPRCCEKCYAEHVQPFKEQLQRLKEKLQEEAK